MKHLNHAENLTGMSEFLLRPNFAKICKQTLKCIVMTCISLKYGSLRLLSIFLSGNQRKSGELLTVGNRQSRNEKIRTLYTRRCPKLLSHPNIGTIWAWPKKFLGQFGTRPKNDQMTSYCPNFLGQIGWTPILKNKMASSEFVTILEFGRWISPRITGIRAEF